MVKGVRFRICCFEAMQPTLWEIVEDNDTNDLEGSGNTKQTKDEATDIIQGR